MLAEETAAADRAPASQLSMYIRLVDTLDHLPSPGAQIQAVVVVQLFLAYSAGLAVQLLAGPEIEVLLHLRLGQRLIFARIMRLGRIAQQLLFLEQMVLYAAVAVVGQSVAFFAGTLERAVMQVVTEMLAKSV